MARTSRCYGGERYSCRLTADRIGAFAAISER